MKRIVFVFIVLVGNVLWSEAQGTWVQKADFGGPPIGLAVGFSINDKGYIGTGVAAGLSKTFWEYDPATDTWTQKADFAGDGREYAIGFAIGNKGYIGTGKISDSKPTDDFWEYDPDSNNWSQKANVPGGIRWNAFSFALMGKGYVGAGQGKGVYKQDFWEYDPETDVWTQKANYGGGKVGGAVSFTITDKAYVGTGRDSYLSYQKDFWEYDVVSGTWTQKADFIGGERSGSVGLSINNSGYIGLGATQDSIFPDFWQYNPGSDTWTQKSQYPGFASSAAVGFSIGDYGYVGTGGQSNQFYQYTPDCIPPLNLNTTNITNSKATLSWNAVSGAVKYKVRYRVSGNNPWTNVGSTTTTKKINGLSANTTYQWQVRTVCSIDPSVSSDWSAKESFTTALRLSDEEETNNIEIYPNPAITSIQLHLPSNHSTTFTLFNLLGEKVNEQTITGSDITIDVSELPAGMYVVRAEGWSGKFVKE